MTAKIFLFLCAIPFVATAVTIAGLISNRSAAREPIVLTEREVQLSYRDNENSATSVSLSWQPPPVTPNTWLNRVKLQDLGFDCDVDPDAADAEEHYRRGLPREIFVAFELDGPAWQALLAEPEADADEHAARDRLLANGSRLVAVDAARNPRQLAQRYPDARTHLITAATAVASRFQLSQGAAPFIAGRIVDLIPNRINVPREWATLLPSGLTGTNGPPRFTVSLRYGRRWEPWVVDVGKP